MSQSVFALTPRGVLLPLQGESGQRASKALHEELGLTEKISMIPFDAISNVQTPQSKGSLPEAEKHVLEAKRLFQTLDFKSAQTHLNQAIMAYKQMDVSLEKQEGLRVCQLVQAQLWLAQNDEASAKKELRELLRQDLNWKKRKLSESEYAPSIRKLFAEVQKEFEREPKGFLNLRSIDGGQVWVDGTDLGALPQKIELPIGEHVIVAQKEGAKPVTQNKYVTSGENTLDIEWVSPLEFKPEFFQIVESASDITPERTAFLDDVGVKLKADVVVFLSPGQAEVKGQLYDLRSQEVSSVISEKTPADLARKLTDQLSAEGYVMSKINKPNLEIQVQQPSPEDANKILVPLDSKTGSTVDRQVYYNKPFYKKHWFWWVVGGVLVGAGGAFAATKLKSGPSTSTLVLDLP